MVYNYNTIRQTAEGLYKEKGSKFIAHALPIKSVEEVNTILADLRKQYYDARHHCYAYILNPEGQQFRANDDGEPNHSAGDPILGQLRALKLTNTLVVVIRYFGGTKLGVSGLINAYRSAARDALDKCTIVSKEVLQPIEFRFAYPETNNVMKLVGKYAIKISEQTYKSECVITGTMPIRYHENLKNELDLLNNTGSQIALIL